jgi:eukaryotic-like serine/threonine-protein kinase
MTAQMTAQAMHPEVIGNYRIIKVLGEGGMGVVYLAEHKLLGRLAAIKVLLPQYSDNKQIVDRFFNEAKAATEIKHPGIVEIYDFGYQDDGGAYIAMEFLEGEDLEARLRRQGQLPIVQAIQFSSQIASALAAAHQRGVIHRDLKPANAFIVPDPQVVGGERIKLLDFGIAKVTLSDGADSEALTRAGTIMGTPAYMAPEQCLGAASVDARADLYSVGCIIFETVCGHPPFRGQSSMDVMKAQLKLAPPRPSELRPEVGAELESVILYLLNKDPAHRYHNAGDLEAALKRLLPTSSPSLSSVSPRTSAADPGVPLWRRLIIPAVVAVTLIAGGAALGIMNKGGSPPGGVADAGADEIDAVNPPPPPPPPPAPLIFCGSGVGACEYPLDVPVVTCRIESRPKRAMVRYKDQNKGETPMIVKVARNADRNESLVLRLYNHADEVFELSAAEDCSVVVEMAPNIMIGIYSTPPGAVIYDATGRGVGETPGEIGVPRGTELMPFLLRKPGYKDEPIEFTPDKARKIKVKLKKLVTVTIDSEPTAEVWKDGANIGQTPYEVQVPPSRDEVVYELKRQGFETESVKVRPDRDRKQHAILKPL